MSSRNLSSRLQGAAGGRTLKVRIPPNPRFSRNVRHEVLSFAGKSKASRDELDDFILAVGEALANAIEHSHSSDVIEVLCQIQDDRILATILDSGAGFSIEPSPHVPLPDALSEHGRGLPIMRHCSDIFAVHSVPGRGTAVVIGRYLRRKNARGDQETNRTS